MIMIEFFLCFLGVFLISVGNRINTAARKIEIYLEQFTEKANLVEFIQISQRACEVKLEEISRNVEALTIIKNKEMQEKCLLSNKRKLAKIKTKKEKE